MHACCGGQHTVYCGQKQYKTLIPGYAARSTNSTESKSSPGTDLYTVQCYTNYYMTLAEVLLQPSGVVGELDCLPEYNTAPFLSFTMTVLLAHAY